jgi:hypothetical protein
MPATSELAKSQGTYGKARVKETGCHHVCESDYRLETTRDEIPRGIGMTALPSILLAIIALIGAWIALQQMLIARAKLNIDLFDRRFAVYVATRKHIVAMLQQKGGTQDDAVEWWAVASSAPFLFDKEITNFIEEVNKRGMGMRARVGDKAIYESQEHVGEYNDHFMWFAKNIDLIEGIFQTDMNLFKLHPFSIKQVLGPGKSET